MRSLLAFLAASFIAAPALAQDVSADVLRELADRFDRAQIEQDRAALEDMTAADLIFVGSNGVRQSRREFIDGWLDPRTDFEPITIVDRYVLPLGPDVGVVGGDVVLRGTSGTQAFATRIRFSDIFRRVNGRWQAVHIQATRVPEPATQP